jgi:serine/threonine protein kinase
MIEEGSGEAKLGKYRILGTLGRGSMGVVYKAEDPAIGRSVAIKTLRKVGNAKFHDTESALARFRTEARSAGRLRHPNIITIFDASINEDTPYIVMDYVEGRSLESVVHEYGKMSPKQTIELIRQIADALDEAHRHGVIHRDIKPSNIVVDSQLRPYILDFGVAKLQEAIQEEVEEAAREPIMGTPAYMSPEQILNRKLTPKSDLFSFALVTFELFTGKRPFPGDSFNEVVNSILHSAPLPITRLCPEFPLQLEVEFEYFLAKNPDDRPSSAMEMLDIMEKCLQPVLERRQPEPPRVRKPSEWKSIDIHPSESGEGDFGSTSASISPVVGGSPALSGSALAPQGGSLGGRPGSSATLPAARGLPPQRAPITPSGGSAPHGFGTPGEVFGGESSEQFQPRVELPSERSPVQVLLTVLGLVAIGVSGFLFAAYARGVSPLALLRFGMQEESVQVLPAEEVKVSESPPLPPPSSPLRELDSRGLLSLVNGKGSGIGEKLEALRELSRRHSPELLEAAPQLLSHESYIVRIEGAKALGEYGDRTIAPVLLNHLSDHDPLVREELVRSLGQLGSLQSVSYLKQLYVEEDHPKVKAEIQRVVELITGLPFSQ